MKKKIFLMLPCIAAVAIATFVGKKTFESRAFESNDLLIANVEALANGGEGGNLKMGCKTVSENVQATELCMHGYSIGFSGVMYSCSEGSDSICIDGPNGSYATCQISPITQKAEHMIWREKDLRVNNCK